LTPRSSRGTPTRNVQPSAARISQLSWGSPLSECRPPQRLARSAPPPCSRYATASRQTGAPCLFRRRTRPAKAAATPDQRLTASRELNPVVVVSFTVALNCIARQGQPVAVSHWETTRPTPPTTS